jgi:hypothetical protein
MRRIPSYRGDATWSMWLSIVALFLGPLGVFACSLAVILGHVGLVQIKRSNGSLGGRSRAVIGLILGYYIQLLFWIWIVYSFVAWSMTY